MLPSGSSSEELYGGILVNVWQEEGNFEDLERCYIQIYPTRFLLYYVKTVELQHMKI